MQNYFDSEATSLYATMKPARGGKSLVTLSTYEDRKEALSNTTLMDDVNICRSNGPKINSLKQIRQQQQQNDAVDGREIKLEAHSNIPKAPPFQLTNSNSNGLQTSASKKSLAFNDQISAQHSTNSSQNNNTNVYNGNETCSRPNKAANTSNGLNCGSTQANRQTLRLGSVTIGEYRQPTLRREPEKFDFISTQKKSRDTGETTPTNEALQSELQSTLTRANLRKSNGNSYIEHQRNCPLHQQQQQFQQRHSVDYHNHDCHSVEELSKKLQKSTINNNEIGDSTAKISNRSVNVASGAVGVGILKNGNRNGTNSSSSKSTEKSIKFG